VHTLLPSSGAKLFTDYYRKLMQPTATDWTPTHPASRAHTALCVDLDGTLVRTDTLHETALLLLKSDPWGFLCALATLLTSGIAAYKRSVARRVAFRPDLLPYRGEVLAYLRAEAAGGRRILLVTAADRAIAEQVARHLGLFEAVLASDGAVNLKSSAKADRIRSYLGGAPFEYMGDALSDLAVWKCASAALLVDPSRRVRRALRRAGVPISREFRAGGRIGGTLRAVRAYQWAKNILVFAPIVLSHRLLDTQRLARTIEAFLAFCMAASVIYVVNDLLDLNADRQHPRKRRRPFAAGTLSIRHGVFLAVAMFALFVLISFRLPPLAGLLMAVYVASSLFYSLYAKTRLFLDVTLLAGLYTLRLLVGGTAADITLSPWTLGFSIFFFTSLASCKRLSELRAAGARAGLVPGRAYFRADLLSLTSLGSASAYAAALVLALYVESPDVVKLYRQPRLLWLLVPLVAYWISRAIMIANRGDMHDDPIVFAFRDRASLVVAFTALIVVAASL
jgi:4-hydroxybenzoate polyprenyltransferase/phosphoserine phosphatase